MVGKSGIGEAVAQHHIATRQGRFNHLAQMVAPGREDQQGFGQRIHGVIQHQLAQLFGQRCAARLPAERDVAPLSPKGLCQAVDVRGLACTVDAFKRDE